MCFHGVPWVSVLALGLCAFMVYLWSLSFRFMCFYGVPLVSVLVLGLCAFIHGIPLLPFSLLASGLCAFMVYLWFLSSGFMCFHGLSCLFLPWGFKDQAADGQQHRPRTPDPHLPDCIMQLLGFLFENTCMMRWKVPQKYEIVT